MRRVDDVFRALFIGDAAAARNASAQSILGGESFDDVCVRVPVERAWSLLTDLPRWPQWASAIGAVVALDDETPCVGARFSMRFASRKRALWHVVALDEGRHLALETRRPGLCARVDMELASVRSDTTRMILRVDLAGPLAEVAWRTAALWLGMDRVSIATEFRVHAELQRELDALP